MPLPVVRENPKEIFGMAFDIVVSDKPLSKVRIEENALLPVNVTPADEEVLDATVAAPRLKYQSSLILLHDVFSNFVASS